MSAAAISEAPSPVLSLAKKLAQIMADVRRLEKTGHNTHFNYSFVEADAVLDEVRLKLAAKSLIVVPSVKRIDWVTTAKGWICRGLWTFTIMDGDSGEVIAFDMAGEGQDSGDKGANKALTAAEKYALLSLFLIPKGSDPDGDVPAPSPSPVGTAGMKSQMRASAPPVGSDNGPPPWTDEEIEGASRASEPGVRAASGKPAAAASAKPRSAPKAVPSLDFAVRFGKSKGKPISKLGLDELAYYSAAAQKSVGDPTKARFIDANKAELEAIQSWIAYRS